LLWVGGTSRAPLSSALNETVAANDQFPVAMSAAVASAAMAGRHMISGTA
jgi:hypothetical protein